MQKVITITKHGALLIQLSKVSSLRESIIMDVTEKQKAYHLRKMTTRIVRLDVNKDGYISREDFEMMVERLNEYSKITKEQAELSRKAMMDVADTLGFKPGVRKEIEEAAKQASENILSVTPERRKALVNNDHNLLFDVFDTNKDGHISPEEFKVYFQVKDPSVSEAEITRCFNIIDSNGDGEISREEFLAAAYDFFCGLEETELSNAFFGTLLP